MQSQSGVASFHKVFVDGCLGDTDKLLLPSVADKLVALERRKEVDAATKALDLSGDFGWELQGSGGELTCGQFHGSVAHQFRNRPSAHPGLVFDAGPLGIGEPGRARRSRLGLY